MSDESTWAKGTRVHASRQSGLHRGAPSPHLSSSQRALDLHDQVAEKLSEVLGHKIEHVKVDEAGRVGGLLRADRPEHLAALLPRLALFALQGGKAGSSDVVERLTGQAAQEPGAVSHGEHVRATMFQMCHCWDI
ncbi:hypothetical protein F5Y15DRAFT_367843 [Xylariaceae sp. FL0016]|nr:hypothetical protein F5Y15DRAFT_367843 [Xylariaceae sp. FL0016]